MKKFLTLTIIAIIALIGLTVSVNAADMNAEAFLADMADGKMSSDVKLTEQVVVDKDMTFDFNGYTLTMTGDANISVQKGELTVKNGTVVAAGYAFRVEASAGNAILNIENDVKVTAVNCAVFIKKPGSVLNTEGDLTSTGGFATISGNGLVENGGVEVNITGGSVTHESYAAVYFPCTTELNISGGTITGTTAVYHKSGALNISGGTLKATGTRADYVHNSNGCNATGDALVIEASDYPGGVPVVSITGGEFISLNNKAIGYYKQTENTKLDNEKFIENGIFSSNVSDYLADGVRLEFDEEKGTYVTPLKLDAPTNVKWDGTKATWDAVPNAASYVVIVCDEHGQIAPDIVTEDTSVDLAEYLTDETKEYMFVVIADSDTVAYLPSIGTESEAYVFPEEDNTDDEITDQVPGDTEDEEIKDDDATGEETPEKEPADDKDDDKKDETPKTGSVDAVLFASAMVAVISVAGIVIVKKYTR